MPIKQKHIIITGANSGIGLNLAKKLCQLDNSILGIDLHDSQMETLKNEFPKFDYLVLDLSIVESLEEIKDWTNSHWPKVDLIFANAGFAKYQSWEDTDFRIWQNMIQVNCLIPIELAKMMRKDPNMQNCRLVITASAMALWPVPGYAAYAASKAALHQFVSAIRAESDEDWLTMVYPIATDTAFFANAGNQIPKAFPVQRTEKVVDKILNGVAKGKKNIYPSLFFYWIMKINRVFPILKPIYFWIENRKLQKWKQHQKLKS